jgi:hypothetical protein
LEIGELGRIILLIDSNLDGPKAESKADLILHSPLSGISEAVLTASFANAARTLSRLQRTGEKG